MKFRNIFKNIWNRKWTFFVILFLITTIGVLYLQKQNLKFQLIIYKSIPHIELTNTFGTDSKGEFSGVIKGFVAFDNKNDQPKDMSQYYIITPKYVADEEINQVFDLEEIIALYPLPPYSLGEVELTTVDKSSNIITLKDDAGNLFFIDKITKKVTTKDAGGDITTLITSDLEYNKFMKEFLPK